MPEISNQLKLRISHCLDNLNKKSLCEALSTGNWAYSYGGPEGYEKFILTFGLSTLFRAVKSNSRLPKKEDITDANAKDMLKEFLQGPGGNDLASLKYNVLSWLVFKSNHVDNIHRLSYVIPTDVNSNQVYHDNGLIRTQDINSDQDAKNFIAYVLNELKNKLSLSAVPATQEKSEEQNRRRSL